MNHKETFEVHSITDETIDALKGMLKQESGKKPVTKELLEAHAKELAGEEAEMRPSQSESD